jgi:hypothetical protein
MLNGTNDSDTPDATNNPNMRVCLKHKRIYLSRTAITLIGNPTHLCFEYDEQDGILYFSPAASNDLDAYEIPNFYWTERGNPCGIARIAFLKALQYRFGWENGSKYYFDGIVIQPDNIPKLAYVLTEGMRIW